MESENRAAVLGIVNHLDGMFLSETSEQLISRVKNMTHFDDNEYIGDYELADVIQLLIDSGTFVTTELTVKASTDIEEDILFVTRSRSVGLLNDMLEDTDLRVVPQGTSLKIVKILVTI